MAVDATPRSVSVVLSTRNDRPFIRDCIDSLLAQDVPVAELIVLDCGSTDGTPELAMSAAEHVRVVRDVAPDAVVDLGRKLARGDVVCVAKGRSLFARGAIRQCLDPVGSGPGTAGGTAPAGLVPVGTTSFGRAVAAVAHWVPIAPPAMTCWTAGAEGAKPDIGSEPAVRCWEYVPATPAALARECFRAGATNPGLDHRIALPAMLVVGSAIAGGRGRGWHRVALPVAHALVCAVLAVRSGKDPGVAPHRAFGALAVGHWASGAGFCRRLVARVQWRKSS